MFISIGILLPIFIFKDILINEFQYQTYKNTSTIAVINDAKETSSSNNTNINFVDSSFGIFIPKINANAKILENIDPFNPIEYDNALKNGIAHAKGSSLPGDSGNIFLFAHSATDFYKNSKLNVKFYLLSKLVKGDLIYISFKGKTTKYVVENLNKVDKNEIKYIGNYLDKNSLTLMTCWPIGIDYKRLIVTAVEQPL